MRRAWDKLSVCVWRSLLAASVEGALGSRRAADLSRLKSFFCVSHLLHRLFDVCGSSCPSASSCPASSDPSPWLPRRGTKDHSDPPSASRRSVLCLTSAKEYTPSSSRLLESVHTMGRGQTVSGQPLPPLGATPGLAHPPLRITAPMWAVIPPSRRPENTAAQMPRLVTSGATTQLWLRVLYQRCARR